jgi:hypothetical protein
MRVLLGGEGEKNWKGYVSCEKHHDHEREGCGAVMEVEEGDLILMYWEDRSLEHFYPAVRCPLCGKYTEVKNVPMAVFERTVDSLKKGKTVFDGYSQTDKAAETGEPKGANAPS